MHAFVAHVPEFLGIHGAIVPYTQQGLEKLNDSLTQFYYLSSNRETEALTQMLQKANRLTHLSENGCQRTKQPQVCFVVNKVTIDEPVPPYTLLLTIWKLNRLINHTTRNLCTIIISEYIQWTMVSTRKKSKLSGIKTTKAERAKRHTQIIIIIHFE